MSIRLAVAGCGGHGMNSHIIPGIALGFEVVAVYDPSRANVSALREQTGFMPQEFGDFDQMVGQSDVDAVLITSPDRYHPQQLLSTVQAGKPVLCDKPLATTTQDLALVESAFTLARQRGQAVLSCHPRRETPDLPYGWVKEHFAQLRNTYGELVHIELDFSYHTPSASWKNDRSLLIDHFSHEIDFLLWLLGDVWFEAWRLADGYDRYCVAGRTNTDTTFLFTGTRRLANKTYPETITLRFNRGTCSVNTKTGVVSYRNHEDEQLAQMVISPTDYDARSRISMSGFADAIRTGESVTPSFHLWHVNASAVSLAEYGHYRASA